MTLSVFERYIPRFFAGAKEIYWKEVKNFDKINKNIFKPPVSEEIKDIVRKNFTREIEFYQFCRQRLHKQFFATELNKN
jgi:dermatan/chondrotin sulfate uronyl 2-O-sulfotransferase UST